MLIQTAEGKRSIDEEPADEPHSPGMRARGHGCQGRWYGGRAVLAVELDRAELGELEEQRDLAIEVGRLHRR